jgi:hypothetical protein
MSNEEFEKALLTHLQLVRDAFHHKKGDKFYDELQKKNDELIKHLIK